MNASLSSAIAAIDAANAQDPQHLDGRPLALLQGELASRWLARLEPQPSDALALAVRAHHLRRWTIERDRYPEGRGGYLRWRRDLKTVHAAAVAEVLAPLDVDASTVERVQQLVQKHGLGSDPEGAEPRGRRLPGVPRDAVRGSGRTPRRRDEDARGVAEDHPKMSPAALELAGDATVPPRAAALLARALATPQR